MREDEPKLEVSIKSIPFAGRRHVCKPTFKPSKVRESGEFSLPKLPRQSYSSLKDSWVPPILNRPKIRPPQGIVTLKFKNLL
jgi:hypothetical protein